ncbi:hypothetical protein L484_013274 [Morus notabilis]|uniref:Uncharacterized protein n=1 Tax=Morus notabilis TaxID=981085 RepID=W9SES9_9ROSA|nr:hypothetical protein L484_013274 [Morus notabilis]
MGRYLMRLKYEKLKENKSTTVVATDDLENDKKVVSLLGEIHLKLIKCKVIRNLQPKIMSSIMFLQRVRDAYVEVMHRFAGHFMQLNNGDHAYCFKKVTCSP